MRDTEYFFVLMLSLLRVIIIIDTVHDICYQVGLEVIPGSGGRRDKVNWLVITFSKNSSFFDLSLIMLHWSFHSGNL